MTNFSFNNFQKASYHLYFPSIGTFQTCYKKLFLCRIALEKEKGRLAFSFLRYLILKIISIFYQNEVFVQMFREYPSAFPG